MPTKIVHNSPKLCAFLDPLIESLSEPQRQHLRDLCDALLVCESERTLTALLRKFVETTDASNWSDFLRVTRGAPGASAPNSLRRKSPSPLSKVKKVVKLEKSTSTLTTRSAKSIATPGGWRSLTSITTIPGARPNSRVMSTASAMSSVRCALGESP